jgi:hypothetical protein
MITSDFMILPLMEVSMKSGEGQRGWRREERLRLRVRLSGERQEVRGERLEGGAGLRLEG